MHVVTCSCLHRYMKSHISIDTESPVQRGSIKHDRQSDRALVRQARKSPTLRFISTMNMRSPSTDDVSKVSAVGNARLDSTRLRFAPSISTDQRHRIGQPCLHSYTTSVCVDYAMKSCCCTLPRGRMRTFDETDRNGTKQTHNIRRIRRRAK